MATSPGTFGTLVLLVGPSGVGKSSIVKELRTRHPEYHLPRSATTRTRRPGEGDEAYYFLTDAEFDDWVKAGKFLEWQVVHQNARYGTITAEIVGAVRAGKTVLREIDIQGLESLKTHPEMLGTDPIRLLSIFILPESTEQLVAHITERAPLPPAELQHRIESMDHELAKAGLCDAKIVNREGQLKETVDEVERLIMRK